MWGILLSDVDVELATRDSLPSTAPKADTRGGHYCPFDGKSLNKEASQFPERLL